MLSTLLLALLATGTWASPVTRRTSTKLQGRRTNGQRELYKRADGSFNLDFLKAETTHLQQKYARRSGSKTKRASGSVPLTDIISGGTDELYYGATQIGSNKQSLNVDFDTGSSDLWVAAIVSGCLSPGFNPLTSTTYKPTLQPFEIVYGSGAVVGIVSTDAVTVGGITTATTQPFGLVGICSQQFIGQPFEGIFGLAFDSISSTGAAPPVQSLAEEGKLTDNLFAFYLGRGKETGSELSIGAVDASHYTGDISYTPVVSKTYWEVQSEQPVVDGQSVGAPYKAAIDTGTTLIYLPTAVASAVASAFGATVDATDTASSGGSTVYQYPCASNKSVALTYAGLDGQTFAINPLDYNLGTVTGSTDQCVFGIFGMDFGGATGGENIAIVGDEFLKSWYSVFDYNGTPKDGAAQVGFAASQA